MFFLQLGEVAYGINIAYFKDRVYDMETLSYLLTSMEVGLTAFVVDVGKQGINMFEPTLSNVICLGVVSSLVCVTFVLILLRSKEDKRASRRFEVNCKVEFTADGTNYSGITQDVSLTGLSIKTDHQFGPYTILYIVVELPGNKTSKLKGLVMRTIKNGVGVKIIENNVDYMRYCNNLQGMKELN